MFPTLCPWLCVPVKRRPDEVPSARTAQESKWTVKWATKWEDTKPESQEREFWICLWVLPALYTFECIPLGMAVGYSQFSPWVWLATCGAACFFWWRTSEMRNVHYISTGKLTAETYVGNQERDTGRVNAAATRLALEMTLLQLVVFVFVIIVHAFNVVNIHGKVISGADTALLRLQSLLRVFILLRLVYWKWGPDTRNRGGSVDSEHSQLRNELLQDSYGTGGSRTASGEIPPTTDFAVRSRVITRAASFP